MNGLNLSVFALIMLIVVFLVLLYALKLICLAARNMVLFAASAFFQNGKHESSEHTVHNYIANYVGFTRKVFKTGYLLFLFSK